MQSWLGGNTFQCRKHDVIAGDALSEKDLTILLVKAFRIALTHADGAMPTYVWCCGKWWMFADVFREVGLDIHELIFWLKPQFVFSRSHYHHRTERCIYGWRSGHGGCKFYGSRNQTEVWEVKRENDHIHPTQKPVELFLRPLQNNTKVGEISYEPFAGSGTHIIAAQKLERRCYAVELDPGYCDVIVERWQNLSGQKAVLVSK
jgi:DNA modification methylase